MKILMLVDYRNSYWSKMGSQETSMDLGILSRCFNKHGYELQIKNIGDINPVEHRNSVYPIIYTSLEDRRLNYKSYIEDIIYGLELCNAWLIPSYKYLRAHHNKVFQEILRKLANNGAIDNMRSVWYGVAEECVAKKDCLEYPLVLKPAAGAKSKGVTLVNDIDELEQAAYKVSTANLDRLASIEYTAKKAWHKIQKKKNRSRIEHYANKFISQKYIKGIDKDYKVLYYYGKYFVLRRKVRENDFRASGSGKFKWPRELPIEILHYAERIVNVFNQPVASLDIAYDGQECFLLEMQYVMFGTYTMERSRRYFTKSEGKWVLNEGESILEEEYARSICSYVSNFMDGIERE